MGLEHFYFLLHDHPDEMRKLIGSIHERELEAFHILANGPCETVILAENTSTYYISPDVYREFNMPHVRDFVDIAHDAGKIAIIHMCGHILNLLQDIRITVRMVNINITLFLINKCLIAFYTETFPGIN